MEIPTQTLLGLHRTMVLIRVFEERVQDLYARGQIPGLAHLYIGEEAVATGVCACLDREDYITSTHRGHGHVIAKGADLKPMMAELFGKITGFCKGKGGSMHIADMDIGIMGANGIAGGGLPIATGLGLACKYKYPGRVAVCFFGDGASNNGTFHESLNLAAVHKLPVVYVCENNLYAISVAQTRHQAIEDISIRALAYGMPGRSVDGNDVVAVYEAAKEAIERARAGEGPTLLECKTYRLRGHHEGDPNLGARYRTKEEIAQWREREPIGRFERYLAEKGLLDEAGAKQVWQEAAQAVEEAVEFAASSPFPPLEELYSDIFA